MTDANIKITIIKNDNTLLDFFAEGDFNNDTYIFTEIPIDENSEFNDGECFNSDDEVEPFYSTSINDLIEKYKSITIQKINKTIII
jgi:hypothetical protein